MTVFDIKVYNTLSRKLEEFVPFEEHVVRMYVCGPTVYDYSHIGHARTYVAFDAIRRYLELRGYQVLYVQNITDIDDKIINRASEEGRSWREVADTYTKDYLDALDKLKISPHIHPRVTMHIKDIVGFIETLVKKGYAYESMGSVYFDVDKYDDYGRLSGRRNSSAWRQDEGLLGEKKHPYDFALWKKAKPGEPSWESPWGPGRPGWHIECSVMSTKYLGTRIDIHGGGGDLLFPHHENERAQSEAALGVRPWVKYWLHAGMLTVRGEKMSKSLGNTVYLKDLLSKYPGGLLRLWVLSSHYRSQLEFNEEKLDSLKSVYSRITSVHADIGRVLREREPSFKLDERDISFIREIEALHKSFHRSMSNDFNTSEALSTYYNATKIYYRILDETENVAPLLLLRQLLDEIDHVFALTETREEKVAGLSEREAELLNLLIEIRRELRKKRDYAIADMIRDSLSRMGIVLMDKGEETRYIIRR